MQKMTKILFFNALLTLIKMDEYNDYDVQSEIKLILDDIKSLTFNFDRLQRRQKNFENSFKKVLNDRSDECCKEISKSIEHIQNLQDTSTSTDSKIGNYLAFKKGISSEKEHLRSMIHSLKHTIETKGFQHKNPKEKDVEIKKLEEKISQQASIISNLSLHLELIKETIDIATNKTKERFETMEKKFGAMSNGIEKRIDSINSSISSMFLKSERKVSFSVQYKPGEGAVAALFHKETAIRFKEVIYNDGDAYNETTGIFTIPVDGVYKFIFFVEGWHQGDTFTCPDAIVALYIEGKAAAAALTDPRHDKQFASSGNAYINYFSKGQRVQVGTMSTCKEYIIGGYRTSFSGHLLY